jgi:type II secretory pathway pseudopilin PulG
MKISLSSGIIDSRSHLRGGRSFIFNAPRTTHHVSALQRFNASTLQRSVAAFTMMEIAISLAIIGIALVAIIGVLPIGMNVQQDNRQQTVVGQDASVFMDAIRNAALGLDDLTNYVYAITNYWVEYNPDGTVNIASNNFYTYQNFGIGTGYYGPINGAQITNGANIIGLMSTPEYTAPNGRPIPTLFNTLGYSNHIVVSVHSISGLAVEKPPQDNSLMQQDSFGYRIYCVNAPLATDTNNYTGNFSSTYQQQLFNSLHDLRLTFLWPVSPNGNLGSGRQTFRTLVAGQLVRQPPLNPQNSPMSFWCNSNFYYYQSQWFTNAP